MKLGNLNNKAKGNTGENLVAFSEATKGRIVTKTGKGSDIESEPNPATPIDPITGKAPDEGYLIEVKTGKSQLTPKQKQTRDENPDKYQVRRPPIK